ncbi:MAG: hypothetical protein J3R72DRAFT_128952 [Linnemannia gamsii]|nr:MAG: hypothetical protein J3R72DRAFT_128952 [Linnemannia gamsii]
MLCTSCPLFASCSVVVVTFLLVHSGKLYVQYLFYPPPTAGAPRPAMPVANISQRDQAILDNLCRRLLSKEMGGYNDDASSSKGGQDDGSNAPFIRTFLTFLYSGNLLLLLDRVSRQHLHWSLQER